MLSSQYDRLCRESKDGEVSRFEQSTVYSKQNEWLNGSGMDESKQSSPSDAIGPAHGSFHFGKLDFTGSLQPEIKRFALLFFFSDLSSLMSLGH